MEAELGRSRLSLGSTMRTRLRARDRDARDQGSRARADTLIGAARSASSSFIAPDYFDSGAAVAVELWAMRLAEPGSRKLLVEYEPPIVPLRYLVRESVVVLSGVTAVLAGLDEQTVEILAAIHGSLAQAGAGWQHAASLGFPPSSQPVADRAAVTPEAGHRTHSRGGRVRFRRWLFDAR